MHRMPWHSRRSPPLARLRQRAAASLAALETPAVTRCPASPVVGYGQLAEGVSQRVGCRLSHGSALQLEQRPCTTNCVTNRYDAAPQQAHANPGTGCDRSRPARAASRWCRTRRHFLSPCQTGHMRRTQSLGKKAHSHQATRHTATRRQGTTRQKLFKLGPRFRTWCRITAGHGAPCMSG